MKRQILALLAITLWLSAGPGIAGSWDAFRENWDPRLSVNLQGVWFTQDSGFEPEDLQARGDATLELSRALSDTVMVRLSPRVNADSLHTKGARLFVEDDAYRPAATLNEALVSWYGEKGELEIGKKIYSWKTGDGVSPLDMLNPVDRIDFLEPEKIGVPSISLLGTFDLFQIQGVLIPLFVPDRLPPDTSRWRRDDAESRDRFRQRFGLDPVPVDIGRNLPEDCWDKPSLAARLSSSTLMEGWDLALVLRHGYSTQGVYHNRIDPFALPLVYRTVEYQAYDLIGASFSTVSGSFEYHGEVAYINTRDNRMEDDYLAFVAGLNYTNHTWLSDWVEEIRFIAEYAGEEITTERSLGSPYSDRGAGRGLTSNLIGSVALKVDEDRIVKAGVIYNLSDEDSLADIHYETRINDHVTLVIGSQRLSGDSTSFFGHWADNDRLYSKLNFQF